MGVLECDRPLVDTVMRCVLTLQDLFAGTVPPNMQLICKKNRARRSRKTSNNTISKHCEEAEHRGTASSRHSP